MLILMTESGKGFRLVDFKMYEKNADQKRNEVRNYNPASFFIDEKVKFGAESA